VVAGLVLLAGMLMNVEVLFVVLESFWLDCFVCCLELMKKGGKRDDGGCDGIYILPAFIKIRMYVINYLLQGF
jgi:hypothetical protein